MFSGRVGPYLFAYTVVLANIVSECEGLKIVSRDEWRAAPPASKPEQLPTIPTSLVVIHHGATRGCTLKPECMEIVKAYQTYHMINNNWNDIGYNFVVGEDGNVYEGRGWNIVGAHAKNYNSQSVGICVIGNFMNNIPNEAAERALKELIDFGVQQNYITTDYKLVGHRQVGATLCPGAKFYKELQNWPHFSERP